MKPALAAAALLALAAPAFAQEAADPPTPASIVASAPAEDWKPIDAADLLVMTLAPDRDGTEREVVIQLMPPPFSQPWVENIRALARAHWWDGTSVYRVVDNWVAQWGDADESKPLPEGVVSPEESYESDPRDVFSQIELQHGSFLVGAIAGGFDPSKPAPSPDDGKSYLSDRYAHTNVILNGWPIAGDPAQLWPIHCYAHVGVARDLESTGTGSELYAVIGHAPRQLDRNIAVVGRVIEGIEHLSTLPRGTGGAGVYETAEERTPIVSVRLGSEVQEFPPPRFEYLASESESFARYVQVRANRNDDFYRVPAGGIDVCNVQVPIRRVPSD